MFLRKRKYDSTGSLSKLAWIRFRRNKVSFSSLVFIGLVALLSIVGYWITPDKTPMVNEQNLLLATLKPGSKVTVLKVCKNQDIPTRNIFHKLLYGQENKYQSYPLSSYRFSSDSIIITEYSKDSSGLEIGFHLANVCYPLYEKSGSKKQGNLISFISLDGKQIKTSVEELRKQITEENIVQKAFILGTDRYGRDVLSQLIIGTRVSLSVGFISVAISLLIGIFLGAIAGYFGGKIDALISWFINIVWAVPTLLLVIAITFALGKGFWQVFVAVGLTMWVEVARVVRGQFMSLREKEFVEAARALGYRNFRIIFKHILPNAMAPVIVISAANFASAILLEAGLSFLGIGVQPPMPSWGGMIKENYAYIILDYAYLAILPGLAIMIMVLAFMLIGNGLRDALDVRTVD
ncbi:MAG: ABC transporter permease [Bacteroidales bacterium]|nr:ABC transporter permease [Bacteroidales bacterium]